MKKQLSIIAAVLIVSACTKEPNVAVRIDCGDYNDKGLQTTINGNTVGDCPIDMMIHAGDLTVTARKDNEDASYFYGEAKMTLAENAMKRIKLDIQPVYPEEYYFRRATDIDGINNYLKHQPDGKRKSELEANLEKIYFDAAKDVDGMTAYINLYSNGAYVKEVRENLESTLAEIEQKKNEAIALAKQRKAEEELIRKETQKKRFLSLGFSDNENGTVTQIENGIIWARCQYPKIMKGSSCVGKDSLYNPNSFITEAEDFGVSNVKNIEYMKRSDWRVITKEAYDFLCSGSNREILGEIFPDYDIKKCWEFAPKKGGLFSVPPPTYLYSSKNTTNSSYVRLVRFPAGLPSSYTKSVNDRFAKLKFVDNRDGTATDRSAGLMWSRCVAGQKFNLITCEGVGKKYNWEEASVVAKKSSLAGYSDWRVPSPQEFKSIIQCASGVGADGFCNFNSNPIPPFVNVDIFPNSYNGVWTNNKSSCGSSYYECADVLVYGQVDSYNVVSGYPVYLVRDAR